MTRGSRVRAVAQTCAAIALLGIVIARFGFEPIVAGLRHIDVAAILAAVLIGAATTVCCAWRWQVVSRGLAVEVGLRPAIAAYYRSIFLNSTLPGGIAGDVHRAVRHGRDADDVAGGVRSVAWDRIAGQAVQMVLTVVVLVLLPSPVRQWMPLAVVVVAGFAVAVFVLMRSDLHRSGLLPRGTWPVVVVTSALVVVGHAAVFLIAARAVGADIGVDRLIPVALIVLAAMSLPLNVAGWGLREGAAAWAFAGVGLGAAVGVSAAVVYGVLSLAAAAPGAAVITKSGLGALTSKEAVRG